MVAIRAGRRWGKNVYGEASAADAIIKGQEIGWFAPEYKRLSESYENIKNYVDQVLTRASKNDGFIRTRNQGRVDFWSLDDENAGRGRKYHKVFVDEGAFGKKKQLLETWERAIKPTLVDYAGQAVVMSNTNGIDPDEFFCEICTGADGQPAQHGQISKHGFKIFHATTKSNPFLPLQKPNEPFADWCRRRAEYFAKLKAGTPPLVYEQEYRANFVDWSGAAFFSRASLMVFNGRGELVPVPFPVRCDAVYAVVDSATKTGKDNDGTAVMFFALVKLGLGYKLVVLDWDISQIEGALLETWLPTIFQQLEHYAKLCGARHGSLGTFIEDKNSGMVLIQQAIRREWPAMAIDSALTALGKDERAISVSGYVYRGEVKFSQHAFDKMVTYKGNSRNHALTQIVGFKIGSKNEQRQDDLLDAFCYGIAIGLGDSEGF